jgi:erythrocyte band 7 integral membrane protein
MDKKLSQPPKFNPMHHIPPPLNPRPQALPQHPHSAHGHPGVHGIIPPPRPSTPGSTHASPFSSSTSAFEMMYSALPSLTETPRHPPTTLTNPPPPLPSAPISQLPLTHRRERLMKRHHTLTSETDTPSGSFDDGGNSSIPPASPKSPGFLEVPDISFTAVQQLELPPHRRDTLEKIPRRARSQSWLVRTRHLLDDDKLIHRTPWISRILHFLSIFFLFITIPFCLPFCVKVAKEYERAVVFRTGRLIKRGTKGPGMFFVIPCIDTFKIVDLRVLSFDVPPQEILSRDSVTVSVEAVIYFRISNPIISVTNVNDAQFSTKLLAQTTLRNVLGTKTLSEILQERDNISSVTEKVLDEGTEPWGVKVQRVEIKDIRLPHQLTRAMAAEAEASRDARARVIAADGEKNASRNLVEAANMLSTTRSAIQLRYLQTLTHIAAQHNHTIVLPVPMEILRKVVGKFGNFTSTAKMKV